MQFYLTWLLLVAITIWVALLALLWGLHSGQFSDPNRARFLPLSGERLELRPIRPLWKGRERYVFLVMAAAVLVMLCTGLYLGTGAARPG